MYNIDNKEFWIDVIGGKNIPARKRIIDDADFFELPHKSEYKIRLGNDTESRTDAYVHVDGHLIGVWRINPYSSTTINRTSYNNRKLTFLKQESYEAMDSDIVPEKETNGLIKVIFKPEKYSKKFIPLNIQKNKNSYSCRSNGENTLGMSNRNTFCSDSINDSTYNFNENSLGVGATVLGDKSNQIFKKTNSITNIDYNRITVIYARLIINNNINKDSHYPRNSNRYPRKINDIINPYNNYHPFFQNEHEHISPPFIRDGFENINSPFLKK